MLCWRRRTVVVFGHTGVLLDDVELRGEVVHPLRYENGMDQIARRRALRSFAGPGALVRRKGTGNRDTRDALAFDPSVRGVFSAIAHRVPERLHQVRVERVVASEPGGHVIVTRHPRRPSPGNRAARLARTPDPVALLSSRRSFFLIVFLRSASPDPTQDRSRTTSREATQHQVSRGDPHSSAGKIFCLQAHCVFLGRNKISVRSVSDSDCRIAAQHVRVRRCLPLGDDKDSLVSFPLAPPIGDRGARARVRLVASNARRRPRSSRAVAGAREHGGRGRASRVLRTARLRSSWFSNLGTPTSTLALTDSPAFPPPPSSRSPGVRGRLR